MKFLNLELNVKKQIKCYLFLLILNFSSILGQNKLEFKEYVYVNKDEFLNEDIKSFTENINIYFNIEDNNIIFFGKLYENELVKVYQNGKVIFDSVISTDYALGQCVDFVKVKKRRKNKLKIVFESGEINIVLKKKFPFLMIDKRNNKIRLSYSNTYMWNTA